MTARGLGYQGIRNFRGRPLWMAPNSMDGVSAEVPPIWSCLGSIEPRASQECNFQSKVFERMFNTLLQMTPWEFIKMPCEERGEATLLGWDQQAPCILGETKKYMNIFLGTDPFLNSVHHFCGHYFDLLWLCMEQIIICYGSMTEKVFCCWYKLWNKLV